MSRLRNLGILAAAIAAAAVAGALSSTASADRPLPAAIALHIAAGLLFVVVGLVIWTRTPGNRVGPLAIAIGFATFIDDLRFLPYSAAFTVADYFGPLQYALLAHLAVAFPGGRLRSRWDRRLVEGVYGWVLLSNLFPEVFWASALPAGPHNLLALHRDAHLHTIVGNVHQVLNVLVALLVIGTVWRHWTLASRPSRRAMAPVAWASGPVAVAIAASNSLGLVDPFGNLKAGTEYLTPAALIILPSAVLIGMLRTSLRHSAVGQLVVELRQAPSPARLRDTLAQTLRDPTLQLAYWVPQEGAYIGTDGRPVDLATVGPNVSTTLIERDDQRIAALLHESSLDEDPWLIDAVAAAAGLALDNERLHAELVAQLAEVRASRARIVEATDAARRRLERDLHDGAQQRLVGLALAVQMARDKLGATPEAQVREILDAAADQVVHALAELRELASGIHPAILTEAGLGPALESLAERAPLPVSVTVSVDGAPAPVEAAAYFLVCEALANVSKHANARSVSVCARREDACLVVEIIDDGVGGADASQGTGLRGMADRLAALDGRVSVVSPEGQGTHISARIPCALS